MKKFAGITAAGLGLIAAGFAAPSQAAAPETHISGNLQYSAMQYWCDHGTPSLAFSYRTLNKTEAKLTVTASGFETYVDEDVSPYTTSNTLTPNPPAANMSVTVHAVGSTTGSSFTISGKTPATCKGLPTTEPEVDWATQGKPTAQPVPSSTNTAPTSTTPAPSKSSTSAPTTTTPVPTKSSTSSTTTATPTPTKSSPAPVKTTTAPSTSMPTAPTSGKGPKVDTDRVATNNDTALYAMAAGAGAVALAGAGTVAARRRK